MSNAAEGGASRRGVLRRIAGVGVGAAVPFGRRTSATDGGSAVVNVGYAGAAGRRAALAAAEDVRRDYGWNAVTVRGPERRLRALRERDDVRYVAADGRKRVITDVRSALPAAATRASSSQALPWGIDRVDADVAHEAGETGDGVNVAIIGTGLDAAHPDLRPNLGEGRAFAPGTGGIDSDGLPAWHDDNGHGTFCGGIADAANNAVGVVGAATDATLHAVKVVTALGVGSASAIAAGIEYAADRGWDVASLSLGSTTPSPVLRDAVRYAAARGTLLIAAAGNTGSSVVYPAAYPEVVAVGATAHDDGLAGFSSTGPQLDMVAPGVGVLSTLPVWIGSYGTLSGTSFAAPHVTGGAALLLAAGVAPEAARERLRATAEDIGLPPESGGAGLLDAAAALGLDSSENLAGEPSGGRVER